MVFENLGEVDGFSFEGTFNAKDAKLAGVIEKTSDQKEGLDELAEDWRIVGFFQSDKHHKKPHPFECRLNVRTNSLAGFYCIGDEQHQFEGIASVEKKKNEKDVLAPIVDVIVVWKELEPIPADYEEVKRVGNQDGNLNAGVDEATKIVICVKRAKGLKDMSLNDLQKVDLVEEIALIWADIEPPPENFVSIDLTPGGFEANLNSGTMGTRVILCQKTTKNPAKALTNIQLMWNDSADLIPSGYSKIFSTPCGLEANANAMNAGHEVYFTCEQKKLSDLISQNAKHPFQGNWETPIGTWEIKTVQPCTVLSIGTTAENKHVTLHCYPKKDKEGGWTAVGTYKCEEKPQVGAAIVQFDSGRKEGLFEFAYGKDGTSWRAFKDYFCSLGFSQDYRSFWINSQRKFSSYSVGNSPQTMMDAALSPEFVDGDNSVYCYTCDSPTPAFRYTAILDPPSHLIVCAKRFNVDYRQGTVTKNLDWMTLTPKLLLKEPRPEITTALANQGCAPQNAEYGLYAVIVHSGNEGGHYYAFVRRSNIGDLTLEDDPENPWRRADDINFEESSWEKLLKRTSINNHSPYVLMYRRQDVDSNSLLPEDPIPENLLSAVEEDNRKHIFEELPRKFNEAFRKNIEVDARVKAKFTLPLEIP
eukprot:TRINITY_DN18316_c0_g1_i1.p1 TRINITY_DN18316_c0_g1~~TRINITY_DN18316_c0_g1_i1.p1  ORF type:complete len:644 (-),score=168.94 TRINITY_DN18316_c0_g1_i1:57-1988(-)